MDWRDVGRQSCQIPTIWVVEHSICKRWPAATIKKSQEILGCQRVCPGLSQMTPHFWRLKISETDDLTHQRSQAEPKWFLGTWIRAAMSWVETLVHPKRTRVLRVVTWELQLPCQNSKNVCLIWQSFEKCLDRPNIGWARWYKNKDRHWNFKTGFNFFSSHAIHHAICFCGCDNTPKGQL